MRVYGSGGTRRAELPYGRNTRTLLRGLAAFPSLTASEMIASLTGTYTTLLKHVGSLDNVSNDFKRGHAKKCLRLGKRLFHENFGLAYGLIVFAMHLEASMLPGRDAAIVHAMTGGMIAEALDLHRQLDQ